MKCWKCSCDLLPCQNKSVLHKLTFFIAPRNKRHHLNFPATDRVQATDHTPSEPRPEEHFQESRHADSHPWDVMITLRNSCLERMFTLRPAAAPALPHQGWARSWCSRSTLRWSAPSRGSASALSGTTAWCGRQRTRTPQQLSLQMWTVKQWSWWSQIWASSISTSSTHDPSLSSARSMQLHVLLS